MAKRKSIALWIPLAAGLALLAIVILLVALPRGVPTLSRFIQAAALLGYSLVFAAIVSSAYTRQLVKLYGKPFVKVHHWVAITGEAMIWAHPILVAVQAASLRVFVPSFASWLQFWSLGGRVAWYLIGVAVMGAVLRKLIGRNWRILHWLNYVAFIFATPHALLIGSTFAANPLLRIVPLTMLVVVIAVFVKRQLLQRARPKR